jgi:hypothetical protein
VNFKKNITTTIENIRQEKLTSFATDDDPTLKNYKESSNLPDEQTISMEDKFEAYMRVIDKVRRLELF